jgi:hypothetical protein
MDGESANLIVMTRLMIWMGIRGAKFLGFLLGIAYKGMSRGTTPRAIAVTVDWNEVLLYDIPVLLRKS